MENTKGYTKIKFDRLIEYTNDRCVFGEGCSTDGRRLAFLFLQEGERVYVRDRKKESWRKLDALDAYLILCKAVAARRRIKTDKKFVYFSVERKRKTRK